MPNDNKNLPAIKDLYEESLLDIRDRDNQFNVLMNQPPADKWLKVHPFITKTVVDETGKKVKAPYIYIPIERIEYLLTRIFQEWRVEIKDVKLLGNSVVTLVRLHFKHVVTGEWTYQDGVGAAPLQTDAGAGATEMDKLKSSAVMMAAPAAESYAIKDAAEKIGKLFGKDLNRADQILYDSMLNQFGVSEKPEDVIIQKIITGFENYKGEDKAKLKKEASDLIKAGKFTVEYGKDLAKKIGVTL